MRRGYVLAVLTVLVLLAGCNGGGGGTPQPIEANATQATVNDGALSNAGYEEANLERTQVNRSGTLSIGGDVQMDLSYQVRATGWRAVYRHGDGPGVFSLYTVPLAKPDNVAATIDPLGDRSLATIIEGAQGSYDDVGELEHVQNRTTTVLGEETVVREYETTATADGESTDVTVRIATVEHDGDVVRAVAVSPSDADDWATVEGLLGRVEH